MSQQNTSVVQPEQKDHPPPVEQVSQAKPPILIFALLTLTNVLINLDHGILPACTKEMKKHFNMGEKALGFMGSIVYLGIVLAGTAVGNLYLRYHSKLLTIIALMSLEFTLVLFILSDQMWAGFVSRFLTGVFQVFLLVYYPVWIDKFGMHLKTTWLTLLQICVPLGIFAGYGITSLVINLGFKYQVSFWIQIVLVAGFLVAFILIPQDKLDCRRKHQEGEGQGSFLDHVPVISDSLISSQIVGPHIQTDIIEGSHRKNRKNQKYINQMKKLLQSKMYIVGTLTMSVILFVSTGVQFWLTDYFIYVLHFAREKVNIAYAVVSLTGPTSGCAFGGYIVDKRGGYDHPTTVYSVFTFAAIGIGCAVVIPFVDGFWIAVVLLWLVLFFGGAMMPGLTGIMMAAVPPYLRAFGNSNGQIIKNIFGYLPAPFMYGWFKSMLGDRAGIKLIMFWGLWAPLLLLLGSIHQYRKLKRLRNSKRESLLSKGESSSDIQQPNLTSSYSIQSESEGPSSPRKKPRNENENPEKKEELEPSPIAVTAVENEATAGKA